MTPLIDVSEHPIITIMAIFIMVVYWWEINRFKGEQFVYQEYENDGGEGMSDRWRYTEACEGNLCIGDCDECPIEDEMFTGVEDEDDV